LIALRHYFIESFVTTGSINKCVIWKLKYTPRPAYEPKFHISITVYHWISEIVILTFQNLDSIETSLYRKIFDHWINQQMCYLKNWGHSVQLTKQNFTFPLLCIIKCLKLSAKDIKTLTALRYYFIESFVITWSISKCVIWKLKYYRSSLWTKISYFHYCISLNIWNCHLNISKPWQHWDITL
jgi:hypothetical protein